jgi:hypothetical protein
VDFDEARQILNKNSNKYTDEQIRAIISLLTEFVKVDIRQFKEGQKNGKSNNIHSSFNR